MSRRVTFRQADVTRRGQGGDQSRPRHRRFEDHAGWRYRSTAGRGAPG